MNSVKRKSKLGVWQCIFRLKSLAITLMAPCALIHLTACDSSNKSSTPSESPIFSASYAQVCNGSTIPGAAAYSTSPGVHPLIIMNRKDTQSSFDEKIPSDRFPKNWLINVTKAKENQLVVCMTATKKELKQKCDFPANKPSDMKHVLEMYNTTYDTILYEAKTGKKIASKKILAKADECPMFHMFSKTEAVDKQDGNYEQALIDFVKPHVQI